VKIQPHSLQREFSTRRPGGQGIRASAGRRAFTLVEVMVVMAILSLIVLALAGVFSTTQRAFRASVTQTDVLQGSRATMDLIAADLRTVTPCGAKGAFATFDTPITNGFATNGINFFISNNATCYSPLLQSLPGTSIYRTNLLQWFFMLSRQNTKWTSVGYIVNTSSTNSVYPLYRYYNETNLNANPNSLFNTFVTQVSRGNDGFTNMSHLIDGVIHLVVRPYDLNGVLMTNGYSTNLMLNPVHNTWFTPPYPTAGGEVGCCMSSNALPASVEVQMAVLEDRAIQRVSSFNPGVSLISATQVTNSLPQWNYLQGLSGQVHVFRQRVTIQNVDPAAYQ
jgi:prepilin-type N-terminal cleavage/methylation domain-containing protein